MAYTYMYTKKATCCGNYDVNVVREVFVEPDAQHPRGVFNQPISQNPDLVNYKAMARLNGTSRRYNEKVGIIGSHSRIGQAAQAIGSAILPGNISPVRSPIRSGVWSALTPGLGGGRGPSREGRSSRCPEGYQYGGRFTDNRLSTCGQKLFDLPSALGATIAAIRRSMRSMNAPVSRQRGRAITPGDYGESPVDTRRPQIPRVGEKNSRAVKMRVKQLAEAMGNPGITATRMVRRDGFVLEPVVSAGVLRTIPDNRDMEGAVYMSTLGKLGDLGGDELGLLSNTGVNSVQWVLPNGSTISIDKVRPLTVGERRKLGRTVNQAIKMSNANDPLARLKFVSNETGNGITVNEKYVGIENPNEMVTLKNGKKRPRWAAELYGKGSAKKTSKASRKKNTDSGSQITDVDDAIAHLNAGGSITNIAPSILQKVLANRAMFKRDRGVITAPDDRKFAIQSTKKDMGHINSLLGYEIQQSLGLESPDAAFIGKGKRRSLLTETPLSTIQGATLDPKANLEDVEPSDMASLLVSDFLSGVNNRKQSTVELLSADDKIRAVATDNPSELVDLDRIKIREQSRLRIEQMKSTQKNGLYGQYFASLREEQRRLFRQQLDRLIKRASRFSVADFRSRLNADGELSDGERTHLNVINRIYEQKLDNLKGSLEAIMSALGGEK